MSREIKHEEIDKIVQTIFDDYNGGKNIDAIKLFSNPDKEEVRELVEHFFRIIYPGYFSPLPPALPFVSVVTAGCSALTSGCAILLN